MRRRFLVTLAAILALSCGIGSISTVQASPIGYRTEGVIDEPYYYSGYSTISGPPNNPANFTGPAVISFQGVSSGALEPRASFSLGTFVISPVAGTTSTYTNTPFLIELDIPSLNHFVSSGSAGGEYVDSMVIHGLLNGTVSGSGQSNVMATISSLQLGTAGMGPIFAVDYYYEFPFPLDSIKIDGPLSLASQSGSGRFTVLANVEPVPEPSTIIVLLTLVAGLGYRHFRSVPETA